MSQKFDPKKGKSTDADRKSGKNGNRKSGHAGHDRSEVIGEALKSFYQTTVNEDVPDDFQNLLDQLN